MVPNVWSPAASQETMTKMEFTPWHLIFKSLQTSLQKIDQGIFEQKYYRGERIFLLVLHCSLWRQEGARLSFHLCQVSQRHDSRSMSRGLLGMDTHSPPTLVRPSHHIFLERKEAFQSRRGLLPGPPHYFIWSSAEWICPGVSAVKLQHIQS